MLDHARHVIAVLILAMFPPALFFWFLIHPFARFWRKLGTTLTYLLVALPILGLAVGLFLARDRLLAGDFGFRVELTALALVLACAGGTIAVRRRRQLGVRVLVGLPELSPADRGGKLLTEGIYGRIRHPRYVELTLFVLAYALFVNYLSIYVAFALMLPTLYLLVLLEERELRERFGAAYAEYCKRVPRFVPRRAATREADPAGSR